MTPTIQQLEAWIDIHGFDASYGTAHAWVIAYTLKREVITKADAVHWQGASSRDLLEEACNIIADELCIVNPSAALTLNNS